NHVTEILDAMGDSARFGCAGPGEIQDVVNQIHRLRESSQSRPQGRFDHVCAAFSKEALLPRLVAILEGRAAAPSVSLKIRPVRTERTVPATNRRLWTTDNGPRTEPIGDGKEKIADWS